MYTHFASAAFAFCLALGFAAGQEPLPQEPPPYLPPGEPEVLPAQYRVPAVADPPPAVVRVQVRVPSAVAPGAGLTYTMVVGNGSPVSAHRVTLRHAMPPGVEKPAFDPAPDNWDQKSPPPKEFLWNFGELAPGKSRQVKVTYTALPQAKQVRATAFVAFEHGQSVTTQVESPKLAVTKSAPERAIAGTLVPVRVEVTNTSPVPVKNVELLETLPPEAEFRGDGEATKNPGQRLWKLGTLNPGERRVVPYQVAGKAAAELLAISAVSGDGVEAGVTRETRTAMETAGMAVAVRGPERVASGDAAEYTVVATNTGTLAIDRAEVRLTFPESCQPTSMSEGGRVGRGEIVWPAPPDRSRGPLKAGEKFELRCKLKSLRAGESAVEARLTGPQLTPQTATAKTLFEGSSLLQGRADLSPGALQVGEAGELNYKVTNDGEGLARGVVVTVTLPESLRADDLPPRARRAGREIQFEAADLPPRGEATYRLKFTADKPDQALIAVQVTESGGNLGVRTTKEVAVTPRR